MSMRSGGGDADEVHGPAGAPSTWKKVYGVDGSFRVRHAADGGAKSSQQLRLWRHATAAVNAVVLQVRR